jgi:hypothetical protein
MAFATIGTRGIQAQSVDLTSKVTGTLPVPNGGLGIASGTTGQFLKFTGTETLASAADNAGKILQIKQDDSTGTTNTSSSSYTHFSGIDLSITPTSASSKILVFFTSNFDNESTDNRQGAVSCWREIDGANNILLSSTMAQPAYSPNTRVSGTVSWIFMDAPSSTGSVRYRPVLKSNTGNQVNMGGFQSTMILMEATI